MQQLNVKQLHVNLGGQDILREVSFSLDRGQIGCLLGPSGCGKTTLLRSIAGFEVPTQGEIWLQGQRVSHNGQALPVEQRKVGMVFQDFALFPHLTVEGNIAFGIRQQSKTAQQQRVAELLELIGLSDTARRYPHELSGGQQQRIALARALAPRPDILLLDEPFSSMDTELREQLARNVRRILKAEEVTALLVTHDQLEAFAMADEIGVMNWGRMLQWDTAYRLYHEPGDRFVADFVGQGAFIRGEVTGPACIKTTLGEICSTEHDFPADPGRMVDVLIRPDDIIHDDDSELSAVVTNKAFRGAEFLYTLELRNGEQLLCYAPSHHNHRLGEAIGIRMEVDHLVAFPARE